MTESLTGFLVFCRTISVALCYLLELAYNLLDEGGYFSFIIPDSLFDAQNEKLRRFLTEKMQIKVIARLGEKIFEEVNRATTVIVCRKEKPVKDSVTHCFRLTTEERRKFLNSNQSLLNFYNEDVHDVLQGRFAENAAVTLTLIHALMKRHCWLKLRSSL